MVLILSIRKGIQMKSLQIWRAGLVLALFVVACSDSTGDNGDDPGADGNTSDTDGSTPVDGGEDDVTLTDGGSFSDAFDECTALAETAANTRGPADVIIAIDNTPSMYNEIEEVRANMNRFSEMVVNEGLDLNIVVIACYTEDCLRQSSWHTICIDPPVGADGACLDTGNLDDSRPPHYLHVNSSVESTKGLLSILDTHDQWGGMLRDGSAKHVVMVSDDNDEMPSAQFMQDFVALDSRLAGFQFHGIFAYLSKEEACAIDETEPCCEFSAPEGEGAIYKELVALTNGVSGDMCLQDFDDVFAEFATAVVASARLNCEWSIPEPPDGMELHADLVNVEYTDGSGQRFLIGRVPSIDQCDQVEHAWYYDNPDAPTLIRICPQTCEWIQDQPEAAIHVQFGCETVWQPEV